MKNFKRLIAVALVLMMVLSFAGCHKKGEIAVTIGDVEFTSAYYMCALVNADAQARNLVAEGLSDEELSGAKDVDYYSKKVEDKDYVKWVEETAMNSLKEIAAYKTLCKENKVEIKEEDINNAKTYAEYYWSSYGYSQYFEPNGVGKETYIDYMADAYYAEEYFEFLYGVEGEKAIAADKVEEAIYSNFLVANVIEYAYDSQMTEADIDLVKKQFQTYLDDLAAGKKTFEQIYKEYNQITDSEETDTTQDAEETDAPKDKYATVLGAEGTTYETEYYKTVNEMAVGERKLINLENNAGIVLVVKQDIKADEYYKKNLDMTARHLLADDEIKKDITEYAKKLDVKVDDYAIKPFKVKKIVIPETTA